MEWCLIIWQIYSFWSFVGTNACSRPEKEDTNCTLDDPNRSLVHMVARSESFRVFGSSKFLNSTPPSFVALEVDRYWCLFVPLFMFL